MKKLTWKEKISKFILAVLVVGVIFSCSNVEQAQAASKKGTYYYGTVLNRTKGGKKYGSWQPGTKKVKYTSKSITFYGSFMKSKKASLEFNKKNFVKYGKKTFKLTSKTKYYWTDEYGRIPAKKYEALKCCKKLNGLMVTLKVTNGKVVSLTFYS